jgi:hypothetical protein
MTSRGEHKVCINIEEVSIYLHLCRQKGRNRNSKKKRVKKNERGK